MVKVFISYSWNVRKAEIIELAEELDKKWGFDVWRDENEMSGSVLSAMAKGIEECDVFLMFFSQHYKNSDNCEKEASFAAKKKKPILPIRVETGAEDAGGWMEMLLGQKLWIDFSDDSCDVATTADKVQQQVEKLLETKDEPENLDELIRLAEQLGLLEDLSDEDEPRKAGSKDGNKFELEIGDDSDDDAGDRAAKQNKYRANDSDDSD